MEPLVLIRTLPSPFSLLVIVSLSSFYPLPASASSSSSSAADSLASLDGGKLTSSSSSSSSAGPSFNVSPQRELVLNVRSGESINLDCPISNLGPYRVTFIKRSANGPKTLTIGTEVWSPDEADRYQIYNDRSSGTWSLKILRASDDDRGDYVCSVSTSVPKRLKFSLNVLSEPVILDYPATSQDQTIDEGSDVTLFCNATGYPQPIIRWIRAGDAPLPYGDTYFLGEALTLTDLKKEDRGTYICVATNDVGPGTKRHVNVKVQFKPIVSSLNPRVGQGTGLVARLECRVDAFPSPVIRWFHVADLISRRVVEISNNMKHEVQATARANDETHTSLTIKNLDERDFGMYSCHAKNDLGSASTEIELYQVAALTHDPNAVVESQHANKAVSSDFRPNDASSISQIRMSICSMAFFFSFTVFFGFFPCTYQSESTFSALFCLVSYFFMSDFVLPSA